MAEIHPGAAIFSEEARRAVAEGSLFDVPHTTGTIWTRDGKQCVVLALAAYDEAPWALLLTTLDPATDPVADLMERSDQGQYRDRATLRRDLLGEGQ